MKFVFLTIALGVGLAGSVHASTFTFDSFSHSDHVTTVLSDDGLISASVSATGGIGEAWAFDTTLDNTRDSDLEGDFSHYLGLLPALDAGRALIIQENTFEADDQAGGGTITFLFNTAVDFLGFTVLDDGRFTVSSTSTADTFAADLHVTNDDGKYGVFSTGNMFLGVSDLTFTLNHSGAIDSLQFVTPIPLPAALPMYLAGFAAFGLIKRRRRRA